MSPDKQHVPFMQDFKKLVVWRKAHAPALNVYRESGTIRNARDVPLRNQMVRAVMSIPANIVEGRSQRSEREFARFLSYALNSARELEYHLRLARDLSPISVRTSDSLKNQVEQVQKMLHGLIARLIKDMPKD